MILKKYFKLICLVILLASNLLVFLIINTSPFFSKNNHVCEKLVFFKTPFTNITGNSTDRIIDEAIFLSDGVATITKKGLQSVIIKANAKMSSCNKSLNILENLVQIESELLYENLSLMTGQSKKAAILNPAVIQEYLNNQSILKLIEKKNMKLITLLVKDTADMNIDNSFYTKLIFLIMNIFLVMFLYTLSFLLKNQSFLKFFTKR